MDESELLKYAAAMLATLFNAAKNRLARKLSKREYDALVSDACREMLKINPDIHDVEAKLLAAGTKGVIYRPELLRAMDMLSKVKQSRAELRVSPKKKGAKKKGAKRMPKKKTAVKKGKKRTLRATVKRKTKVKMATKRA